VCSDGLTDLQPAQYAFVHVTLRVACFQRHAVRKGNRIVIGVDIGNYIAFVLVQLLDLS